ncbi:hypothetical protein QBC46DRAFT_257296 [Diplogelasinospora grovesii]|uniref:Uncharacterized protein n=1 Tax=Diplogelasinospora grovesii TaxID=303347 RepID=A0AAN6S6Q8_9PEZI|nr:hypothetical protein QBC46DRAFT_257296 [Diplogelasinospora grovesii]
MSRASSAIRYAAATRKSLATLYIQCNVKPGASKAREGVVSARADAEAIDICVAEQAREGEANKAVLRVLSEALDVPKSYLRITQGLKSRQKTIALDVGSVGGGKEEDVVGRYWEFLSRAAGSDQPTK